MKNDYDPHDRLAEVIEEMTSYIDQNETPPKSLSRKFAMHSLFTLPDDKRIPHLEKFLKMFGDEAVQKIDDRRLMREAGIETLKLIADLERLGVTPYVSGMETGRLEVKRRRGPKARSLK